MPYRMSKFPYGYIDEISGEMLRVGKTRYGNWLVQYRRKFGVLPRNIGEGHRTKAQAIKALTAIKHSTSSQLLNMSREVK